MHRTRLVAILLLAVSLSPFVPPLVGGRPGLGHDYPFHYAHTNAFRQGLAEGELYPRWAAAVNGGYGAPTFLYYPPLPYLLAALGNAVTDDTDTGFLLAAALIGLLGCVSLYHLIRRDAGPAGALLGAAAFAWLPYVTLDLYHRFAWAEFHAIMWLPAVLLALRRHLDRPRGLTFLALTGALAALACSHLVTAITAAPLLAAWVGYEALRRRSWRTLLDAALPCICAAALASAFLLPVLLDRNLVHIELITASRHGQYGRNFLFQDATPFGHTPTPFKPTVALTAAAQLVLVLGAVATLALRRRLAGVAVFLALAALAHLFLTAFPSEPIWRALPLLQTIQFPWRLLGAMGVLTAWLVGLTLGRPPPGTRLPRAALWLVALPIGAAFALSVQQIYTSYHPYGPWMEDRRQWDRTEGVPAREYVPRDVAYGEQLHRMTFDPSLREVSRRGDAEVRWQQWTPHTRRARVRAGAAGVTLVLPIFRFPGWEATVDGAPASIDGANARKLIEVTVPAGTHELVVRNRPPASRRTGTWISLAGLLAALLLAWRPRSATRPATRPAPRPFFTGRTRYALGAAGVVVLTLPIAFPPPRRLPHVVLITAPGLRADHASFNGYARKTTPNMNYLGWIEGTRFRRAQTPVPDAAHAAAAVFGEADLIARLRAEGYTVGAILGEDLRRGLPQLEAAFPDAVVPAQRGRMADAEVIARAMVWLRAHRHDTAPVVLWLHLAETGGPWRPLPDRIFSSPPGPHVAPGRIDPVLALPMGRGRVLTDLSIYRDLYDESLVRFDQLIGGFMDDLYRIGYYDRALFGVAGLSGVNFGEGPGPVRVGGSLHEVQTAVMFVLKYPGNRYYMRAVRETPVSLTGFAHAALAYLHGVPEDDPLSRAIDGTTPAPEVEVRLADDSARKRVFADFSVRWPRAGGPVVIRWIPGPPWEAPWEGQLPAAADTLIRESP